MVKMTRLGTLGLRNRGADSWLWLAQQTREEDGLWREEWSQSALAGSPDTPCEEAQGTGPFTHSGI